ncbi:DIS3-like exonuclease 2 [Anopheles ziemanni]|uniref:DIS3-like exonuclease 2 n=1 Tax=Anopheles coustani TaxID=139045 RepID=UPI00265A3B76|nr:DIS3-like exonuclease 2 [Anopheles coustani]XP_058178768.1 DIS3-like exonuclease 2 [Anopheles ziemanni]
MSDADFLRELRDDIADSTRKMMEEAPAAGGKAKVKKVEKEPAKGTDQGKSSTSAPQSKAEGDDTVAKVAMELVQLSIETKLEQKLDMDVAQLDVRKMNSDEPPPGIPEVMVGPEVKKSKKEAKQKSKKIKDVKQKELKKKEKKMKEMHKKAMEKKEKRETGSSDENSEDSFDEKVGVQLNMNQQQLVKLKIQIQKIEEQIHVIKEDYHHREAKPVVNRKEVPTASMDTSKKVDKSTIKEKKPKKIRSESESSRQDTKSKPKKHEKVAKGAPKRNEQQDTDGEASSEEKLLLLLFTLSSSQRRKYIEKRGIELGLLNPHPFKRHVVLVNDGFQHLSQSLFSKAKNYIAPTKTIEEPPASKPVEQKAKFKLQYKPFEEQVNYLLNNGKQGAAESDTPELTLSDVRDEAQMIVQDRLDAFVRQLAEKNVGYLMEGLIRINVRNNTQSFVDDTSREGNVYINSIILRRCAMEGDLVRVFVMNQPASPESPQAANLSETDTDCLDSTIDSTADDTIVEQKETFSQNNVGFVVKILEKRNKRQCVGKFSPYGPGKKQYRTFNPRDMRIPPVRIFKQDWPNALIEAQPTSAMEGGDGDGKKVPASTDVTEVLYQAEIIEWHNDIPIGTILKSIGKCGVLEVENESILVEYNLDVTPYGDDILAQLPSVPYSIPQEEIARREDLRGECIFTIDPATARDLDDALSCKVLPNGNFQVGVHISDVTYFLREQSELDELVKQRATSIYMVDAVYHMLPKQLCNTCSLLPGQDKLAFSVFWEMQPDGTVLSTRFTRSVINSCAQLSYEHAQMMLDNPKGDGLVEDLFPEIMHGHTVQSLGIIVNQLQSIAVKLRQRRLDDGCLKINQPKLTFRLDPATGRPIDYGVYKLRASNEMIEDFMLLANTSVAQAIHAAFPSISLLRNHKPPAENMMKNLVRTLASFGYTFSYATSKAIRESMDAIVNGAEHPDAACSVLNVLLSKPMTRALYYCSAFGSGPDQFKHYALAIPMYTHFTSPIRRYADCLVHRVLAASLGIDDEPKRTPDELQKLATICNEKKYNAKLAGDASSMLYYRHWLESVKQHETIAAVLGYGAHHIELVLIHSGIVLKASLKKISAVASVVFKPIDPVGSLQLIPNDSSIEPVKLTIFSKVRVTIKLVHGAIAICSMLPMAAEVHPTDKEESNPPASQKDFDKNVEMKSARVY